MSSPSSPIIDPASQIILPPSARGPLVRLARVKWERDPEMSDLIDYFDEPRFHGPKIKSDADRFELLTVREVQTIQGIAQKCRESFTYAARNFFWITTKSRGDQLFKLWESQELIYQELMRLKARGVPMKLQILKARQLGSSTVIEGLIAWRTMFFRNVNAIVVSYDADHAAYLFGIMQHIFDMMPWFLKPECSSREYKDGLNFENPDYATRRMNPGLVSKVSVQAANKRTGVGTGTRINAGHLSEYGLWHPDYARDVIEQDVGNALAEDDPEMFCILESTARGAGTYSYRLWNKNVELGDQAEWHPLFLPWFFESTRVLAPPRGWRPEAPEATMNERVQIDWIRCDNNDCRQYQERYYKTADRDGNPCSTCKAGTMRSYSLTPDQMYWMQRKRKNAQKEAESLKKLAQEQACVSGDTMVSSDKGILRIDSSMGVTKIDGRDITAWIPQGVKPVGELTTKRGRKLKTTYDHEFSITDGRWVDACELSVGDKIVLCPPKFSESYCTVEWSVTPYVKSSITVDETFGRFLGYFMGDGCWRGNGVNISCDLKDKDVIDDAERVLQAVSGHSCFKRIQGQMEVVNCGSAEWLDMLLAIGALRKNCKESRSESYKKATRGYIRNVCVLECIWQSPRSVVKEFLSALFECDGYASHRIPYVKFFTCWDKFAQDVMLLLLGFGINGKVNSPIKVRKLPDGGTRTYGGKEIVLNSDASNKFHRDIGFIGRRKRSACVRDEGKYTSKRKKFRNEMEDEFLSFVPCGDMEVFDITVPETQSFGANGLLVHNCTAESAFTLSGTPVFGEGAQEWVNSCVRPPAKEGFLDSAGNFHGCNPRDSRRNPITNEFYEACYLDGCDQDHTFGDHNGETPYHVWKEVEKDIEYCIGADVSEGLGGEFDYSVGVVLKVNRRGGPDEVVAVFRSNLVDPVAFAQVLNFMGRHYNESMLAIEVNRYDTCMSWVRFQLQYPNLYRWKHMDSINPLSNKLGWLTNVSSKPRLYQTMKRWLQHKLLIVPSRNFAAEMKTFTKDEDERGATAENGSFDDECIACQISLYCAHEGDWDDSLGQMSIKRELSMDTAPWHMSCSSCQLLWPAHNNTEKNCPRCGCMVISGKANRDPGASGNQADAFTDGLISRQDAKEFSVSTTEDKSAEEPDYSIPFVCG